MNFFENSAKLKNWSAPCLLRSVVASSTIGSMSTTFLECACCASGLASSPASSLTRRQNTRTFLYAVNTSSEHVSSSSCIWALPACALPAWETVYHDLDTRTPWSSVKYKTRRGPTSAGRAGATAGEIGGLPNMSGRSCLLDFTTSLVSRASVSNSSTALKISSEGPSRNWRPAGPMKRRTPVRSSACFSCSSFHTRNSCSTMLWVFLSSATLKAKRMRDTWCWPFTCCSTCASKVDRLVSCASSSMTSCTSVRGRRRCTGASTSSPAGASAPSVPPVPVRVVAIRPPPAKAWRRRAGGRP
mmetsp:Transcript_106488/g.301233  ORF Transcript_106488/g.301233 Transcript_106488/m.301233 type:complete len:301 (+) Transcript_106488:195-1097(+)